MWCDASESETYPEHHASKCKETKKKQKSASSPYNLHENNTSPWNEPNEDRFHSHASTQLVSDPSQMGGNDSQDLLLLKSGGVV